MSSMRTLSVCYLVLVAAGAYLRFAPPSPDRNVVVKAIARLRPNAAAAVNQRRGYYESLAAAGRLDQDSWAALPADYGRCVLAPFGSPGSILTRPPARGWTSFRHKPGVVDICFGVPWRTNRFGFRGPEWQPVPAPGTMRIAVVDASYTVGVGVVEPETFPRVLEGLLDGAGRGHYEVVNAATTGFTALDQASVIEDVIATSAPNLILYVATSIDADRVQDRLLSTSERYALTPDQLARMPATLRAPVDRARAATGPAELRGAVSEVLDESYRLFAETARANQIPVAWALIPAVDEDEWAAELNRRARDELTARARRVGFLVLDTEGVWGGYDPVELWVHDYDAHPGALGHRLIATKLADALIAPDAAGHLMPHRTTNPPGSPR